MPAAIYGGAEAKPAREASGQLALQSALRSALLYMDITRVYQYAVDDEDIDRLLNVDAVR
jgi:hypothetical protein